MHKEIIGNCTLYLGDCTDIMLLLPDFDELLTDLPYGLGKRIYEAQNQSLMYL